MYVQVYSNSSGVIVQLNGNERIAVKNSSKYKSIYQNKLIEEYPKYLIIQIIIIIFQIIKL